VTEPFKWAPIPLFDRAHFSRCADCTHSLPSSLFKHGQSTDGGACVYRESVNTSMRAGTDAPTFTCFTDAGRKCGLRWFFLEISASLIVYAQFRFHWQGNESIGDRSHSLPATRKPAATSMRVTYSYFPG
jgi:hypothetical protein